LNQHLSKIDDKISKIKASLIILDLINYIFD